MKCGRRPEWRTEKDDLYNSLTAGLWGIITSWREGEAELREIEEEIRQLEAQERRTEKKKEEG